MIDLYYFPTGNGFRAAIALEECGLAYRRHKVNILKGEENNPEFAALNPMREIPVLVDGDGPGGRPITLSQSGAIMLYAAEKSGRHLPTDPEPRLQVIRWLFAAASDAAPICRALFYMALAPDHSDANRDFLERRLITVLQGFQMQLGNKDYLIGELSIADLALYPDVAMRRKLVEQSGQLGALMAWMDRLAMRHGIARAMSF